jgi:hypothetical protein
MLERVEVIPVTALLLVEVIDASVAGVNRGASFAGRLVFTRVSLIDGGTYLDVMVNSYYYKHSDNCLSLFIEKLEIIF